jgi:hypothetical protein
METACVLCDVQAKAKDTSDDLNILSFTNTSRKCSILSLTRAVQEIKYHNFYVINARSKAEQGGQKKIWFFKDWSEGVHR